MLSVTLINMFTMWGITKWYATTDMSKLFPEPEPTKSHLTAISVSQNQD